MKLKIVSFLQDGGWQISLPTELDSTNTLVIVFGDSDFSDNLTPFRDLLTAFPDSKIIGCSTSGEIFGTNVTNDSCVVAIAKFLRTELKIVTTKVTENEKSFEAGKDIAEMLNQKDLAGVFVLSDGLNINGSELVSGLNSVLPAEIVVTGGLAGDQAKFKNTWVLNNGLPVEKTVSAIGFYGNSIVFKHASKGGWNIFGPERRVTKSDRNNLYELDGSPALELYKKYLGDRAKELPASALLFPLGLNSDSGEKTIVVRTILNIDEEKQSLIFAGDIPEGSIVQLMTSSLDRIIDGASQAAEEIVEDETMTTGDTLSIAISCIGRRLLLGDRTEEELEAVIDVSPDNKNQIGFYSYGEISPINNGHCALHNQTMTLTTILER